VVEGLKDRVGFAIAMNATDEHGMRLHGVHKVDAAIISMGDNFEATVLATVLLKQMGVPLVISRATRAISGQVLSRIGADAVVNPEDESADRWAQRLVNPHFMNQIEFHEGYSIVEVQTPRAWVGKSLAELDLRAKYALHVVAIKRPRAGEIGGAAFSEGAGAMLRPPSPPPKPAQPQDAGSSRRRPAADSLRVEMPSPTLPLQPEDILVLMGKNEDLAKVPRE
jgi:trk system potassium uptake protein